MWTLVIICLIGMALFWAFTCAVILSHQEIEKWARVIIGLTAVPTMFGMLTLVIATTALDDSHKEVDMLYKKMKKQEKYELIQEPVYRKIK